MGSKFEVPCGACAGSYDGVLVSTDLEPDDAIAIKLLAPRLRGVRLLVVLGEGDLDKTQMASQMLAAYGLDESATIVQGRRSSVRYPVEAIDSFADRGAPSSAQILPGGEEAAAAATAAFLAECAAPFAWLLKPPFELLGAEPAILAKTVAALYGSFNVVCLRKAYSAKQGAGDAERARFFEQEERMYRSLKRLLLVDRSLSVGRDSVLQPTSQPALWDWMQSDAQLMRLVSAWNEIALRGKTASIEKTARDVRAAMEESGSMGAASFRALVPQAQAIDKSIKIVLSILENAGLQVCNADTATAAALLDADGELARHERPCRLDFDREAPKPVVMLDGEPQSNLYILHAEGSANQQELSELTCKVLAGCIVSS
jgi:hypothetical protein